MCNDDSENIKAYLFFSVDICDSTKYKLEDSDWNVKFKTFYEEFASKFDTYINNENSNYAQIQQRERNGFSLPHPTLWKLIGDEILFFTEIRDYYESVLFSMIAFRNIVIDYNSNENGKFKLKGTIWFCNIPKSNNIKLTTEVQKYSLVDFLGSSIDVGFRLTKYSNMEKMIISVETAILLIRDNYLTLQEKGINIYFDGTTELKGLDSSISNYPLIWIDLLDKGNMETEISRLQAEKTSNIKLELQLLKREIQKACLSDLLRYCQIFLKTTNGMLCYPKIPGDRLFSS